MLLLSRPPTLGQRVRRSLAALAACAVCAGPALASDGVIEINHAAALAGGVTGGDTPGYPVSISAPGSYVLTGPLTVTGTASAIEVTVDEVSIDLNGFAIVGPETCTGTGATLSCSGASGGGGIYTIAGKSRLSVHDGVIRGFERGILTGAQARIERVSLAQIRDVGIQAGSDARIRGCQVKWTGAYGIWVLGPANVLDNIVAEGSAVGIFAAGNSVVRGNTVRENGGGIDVGEISVVEGNSVAYSHGSSLGIYAGSHATIAGNAVTANAGGGVFAGEASLVERNTVSSNFGTGVTAGDGSTVQRNTIANNSAFGLSLGGGATYRENTISGNGGGTVTGTGTNMLSNSCNGATTCP